MFRVVSPPIIRSCSSRPVTITTDAADTVTLAPDDRWRYHPKHVEWFTDINKLYIVASCWVIIGKYVTMHGPLNVTVVPVQSRSRQVVVTVSLMPDAEDTVT